ncbi:hypothetical protein [Yoonia sp. R2-816]|uniref:hypothetical protein n=1 Tax=Yoonia sp. R2-816 TaxID=3342638 RepID=UPI00372B221C
MYRCAFRVVAFTSMLATQSHAQMNEYWTIPDTLDHAIESAKQLYPENENPTHPEIIALDQEPVELHGLYATLNARHASMKIVTFPRPPAPLQEIPTSFAPGSLEDQMVGFIHKYEAPEKGYDAVWNKNKHPLPRAPTQMTVCEVRDWQLQARLSFCQHGLTKQWLSRSEVHSVPLIYHLPPDFECPECAVRDMLRERILVWRWRPPGGSSA